MSLKEYIADITTANKELFFRYHAMTGGINELSHIRDMCEKALLNLEYMPIDKQSRWVGYVQRELILKNIIDTSAERLYTRGIFTPIYKKYDLPHITISVEVTP